MGSVSDKLNLLFNTKDAIKNAIISKGVSVPDTTPFSGYAAKINAIQPLSMATVQIKNNTSSVLYACYVNWYSMNTFNTTISNGAAITASCPMYSYIYINTYANMNNVQISAGINQIFKDAFSLGYNGLLLEVKSSGSVTIS